MTTPTPPTPVRLHDHWRLPMRVEADDQLTLARAARVTTAARYLITASTHGTQPGHSRNTFWCDDFGSVDDLRRMLIDAGIPAVIASSTRPTPAEAAADAAAWQEQMARMAPEAEAWVKAQAQRPPRHPWAPF